MTMKKILMAAVAISALTAGAANAVNITAANVSGIALGVADPVTGLGATNYVLANSAITLDGLVPVAANIATAGTTDVTATVSAATANFAPNAGGTNYSVTYTLGGTAGATFSSAVTAAQFTIPAQGASTCTPTGLNTVAGGAIGTSSVTAVFTIPSGTCSSTTLATLAPKSVQITAPFKIATAGTVTGSVSFKVVSTDSAYDGAAATQTLVSTATPYTVAVTADTTPTTLGLATPTAAAYSYFSTANLTIGSTNVALKAAPTAAAVGIDTAAEILAAVGSQKVYADMSRTLLPAITYDVKVDALNGNFAVIKPAFDAVAMTLATPSASSATKAGASGSKNITVSISGANTTSVPTAQTYSATITPTIGVSTKITTPAAVTGALETIGIQGVSFLAPWIGGSKSASSSYIRISNNGAAAGQVTLALLAPVGATSATLAGTVCTSATVSKLASIATGSELVISPDDLTSCFGAFTRGDVSVTVQSTGTGLTAKARNVTASTVSELSLGAGTFN